MKGNPRDADAEHTLVETEALNIHIPSSMVFSGDIPRIVVFPRNDGRRDVGVPDVLDW